MSNAAESFGTPLAEPAYPSRGIAWYATILLAVLYWLSVLDRFIISLLVEPIKRDLGLTDLQFGMLHGFAFAATFSLFGIVLGTLADRVSRRWVIFSGVAVWSLATAACGFAKNFWHLMLARVGVGAGEATLMPCATSMLADLFPRERLTFAMAVYAMGSTIGAGTAYLVGGLVVNMVSQAEVFPLPLLGDVRSWQAVFFIVGIPGALISLLIFTVPEPARRGVQASVPQRRSWLSSYAELWKLIKKRPRFFTCHYIGFGLASAVVAGGGGWYPVHMGRTFGWSAGQIGLSLGLVTVVAALIGKSISGKIMDAMYRREIRDAQMRWYLGCMIAVVPVAIFTFTSSDPYVFLGGILLYLMLIQPLPVCCFTSLNLVTPNNLRGTGVAFFGATAGLVGGSIGPMLTPAAAQYIYRSESAIGLGMATVAAVVCPIAAVALFAGLKSMREAVAQADQDANQVSVR